MMTYLLFFFPPCTSAVLVNSSLIPHLESLTPPSSKHTIFGRHYNSSPLALTHSLTDTQPRTHTPLPPHWPILQHSFRPSARAHRVYGAAGF